MLILLVTYSAIITVAFIAAIQKLKGMTESKVEAFEEVEECPICHTKAVDIYGECPECDGCFEDKEIDCVRWYIEDLETALYDHGLDDSFLPRLIEMFRASHEQRVSYSNFVIEELISTIKNERDVKGL